ncbi:hypothetical protein COU19_01610, partial [Candidatus Kaiserbacteria bacterium CG10_big_fil_rev_8_21_14_0_10_56_12]
GFTVAEQAIFDLEDRLVTAHSKIGAGSLSDGDLSLRADGVIAPDEVDLAFLKQVEKLAPFGIDNPKPVFLLNNVTVESTARFGKAGEHLKLRVTTDTRRLDAVTFFAKGALARTADALRAGSRAHILAHVERDTFSRANPVRLRLLDVRTA